MQSTLARLGHVLLTAGQDLDLLANLVQSAEDLAVSIDESQNGVGDFRLLAELADHDLDLAEVMSWYTGEEMVNGLELEATVDEVQPGRAVDVHGGSELALGEGFVLAEVGCGHSPVGEGDLDVKRHGNDMRDQDEHDTGRPVWQRAPEEKVAKDEPVAGHKGDLGWANPPGLAASETSGLR